MTYTDKEMRAFTQVAYADFDKAKSYLQSKFPERKSFTITELKIAAKALGSSDKDLECLNCLTKQQCDNWSISVIHDTNSNNGFYGCIIETSPGNAVLAFRGSESMESMDNIINDWGRADLGLLNSTLTNQQAEVDRFLKAHKTELQGYDSIALTGHSLGGNLAQYATLVSHKYGFDSKITQSISFDGPGFSDEFIALHMLDILRMRNVMSHYQFSPVGMALFSLPGINTRTIKVSNEANEKDDEKMNDFTRHDTKYIEFDNNGNVKKGEVNKKPASLLGPLSKIIELSPFSPVIHYSIISLTFFLDVKQRYDVFLDRVMKQAKLTYRDLAAKFKKLLAGHNYYKVSTAKLNRDVKEVRSELTKTLAYVDEMFSNIQQLNTMWKGPASNAFISKFASEREQIRKYLRDIERYAASLEKDRDNYNRCEERASSIVSGLRF